jgi:hypothetical protein
MNYYIMQSRLGAKPELIHWAKTQAEAISYARNQLALWNEAGVTNPPRYTVHYNGLSGHPALWSSLD